MGLLLYSSIFYQQGFSYLSPTLFFGTIIALLIVLTNKNIKFNFELFLILSLPLLLSVLTSIIGLIFQNFDSYYFFLSLTTLFHHMVYITLFVFLFSSLKKSYSLFTLQSAMLVLSFFGFLQLFQYQFNLNVFHLRATHPAFAGHMGEIFGGDYSGATFRISGLFQEPGDLTMFLSPLILLIYFHYDFKRSFSLGIISVLLFNFSRGLSGIVAMVCTILFINLNRLVNLRYLMIIGFMLTLFIFNYSERLSYIIQGNDPSFNMRFLTITSGIEYIYQDGSDFFFGKGLGSSAEINLNTGDTSIKSDYIRILFEQGLVGLSLYTVYVMYILSFYRHKKTFIAIFVYFLMLGILGDTMSLFYRYIFLSMAFLSISHRNIEERSEKEKNLIYSN